jgi:glycosyltransferase involved in cell wall biosynthesis
VKLALYHPWIYLAGGIERTIAQIIQRSEHEWTVYTHHLSLPTTFPALADANVVVLRPGISVRRSAVPLAFAAATIATTRLPLSGKQALLVSSDGFGDFILSRNRRLPAVCYCHTPLKIVHDPATRSRLVAGSRLRAAGVAAAAMPYNVVDRRLWRRYRFVLTNSSETRERISRARLRARDQVEVLHPGVDPELFKPGLARREPTFLVAGRIMWQKNVELAIDAVGELLRRGLPASLVVAGAVDAKSTGYLATLRKRAVGLPVQFEPNVEDRRMAQLYATSTALLFTPPNEDFGIVPLEAMACGTPVLSVAAGGPAESVLDAETGWLLPPDVDAFADHMARFVQGGSWLARMRRAARVQAERYSWEDFVARVDDVMEAAVASGPPIRARSGAAA